MSRFKSEIGLERPTGFQPFTVAFHLSDEIGAVYVILRVLDCDAQFGYDPHAFLVMGKRRTRNIRPRQGSLTQP